MDPGSENRRSSKLATAGVVAGVVVGLFVVARLTGMLGTCGLPGCGTAGGGFGDDMEQVKKTDPKLVIARELKRFDLGLTKARAIAISRDGKLYAGGAGEIVVFDRMNGTRLSSFVVGGDVTALGVGPDGTVYAGLGDHIETYDAAGKQKAKWASLGEKAVITSISADSAEVWAGDAGNRVIVKCDTTGQVLAQVGKKDASKHAPGIVVPSPHLDVAFAGSGAVWVANPGQHELEYYAADGTMAKAWGKSTFAVEGFGGCCNPTDFAMLPNGKFVTSEKGIPRVKVYSADGKFEGVVAGYESFKPDVSGLDLAVDPQSDIFVLDPSVGQVRVYVLKESK